MEKYRNSVDSMWVYDDGAVKGFIQVDHHEIKKLFVEPALQGNSIGSKLLDHAVRECSANYLWALEKNTRAISFYERHGFRTTTDQKLEEDTTEFLIRLER